MKIYLSIFCLALVLVSCKNNSGNNDPDLPAEKKGTMQPDSIKSNTKIDISENSEERTKNNLDSLSSVISGNTYQKNNESNCSCYCLKFETNNRVELCLAEDDLYIEAKYNQAGDVVNFYYVKALNQENNQDIPWEKFDTNTPVAVLNQAENGMLTLDWKGFSIDGELAVDYAIYGKKTLEGTYKKI